MANNVITTIAEIGINANGSVELAKQLIDVASSAGCDFVKFQKRDVENGGCYTKEELDAPRESKWGTTNRHQKLGLEFSLKQFNEIDEHCKSKNIQWFASAWDIQSVEFLETNFPSLPYHKVASALLTNKRFLEALKETGKPVIISTGMSTEKQILCACEILGDNVDTILHCTSTYPCKPEEMNLSYITTLIRERTFYQKSHRIGFSNHYSGIAWASAAIALGAEVLEFHITLDRSMAGSDQASSLEPNAVKKICEYARLIPQMLGDGRKTVYSSELPIIKKLRKVSDF